MAEAKGYSVVMPKFGLTMVQAQLVEWRVNEGEFINKGDILFTLESEKSTLEIESPASGYVHILVQAGDTVAVNTEICVIRSEPFSEGIMVSNEKGNSRVASIDQAKKSDVELNKPRGFVGQTAVKAAASPRARILARESGIELEQLKGTGPRGMIVVTDIQKATVQKPKYESLKATPIARRLAKESGIDLHTIEGTGSRGEITRKDVEEWIGVGTQIGIEVPTEPSEVAIPLSGLRQIISERLGSSWRERPHVTLTTEIDAEQLLSARLQVMEKTGSKVSYNSFFILAAAKALQELPYVNISLTDDGIIQHEAINVGLAVDTDKGLLVPVIRNADKKGLQEIENEIQTMVKRALTGTSLPDDLSSGTFTITNLGTYGIEAFTPIINPPETAILGIGAIIPKAVVVNDQIIAQNRLMLSLSHDHRILDGAPAARFLQRVAELISRPLVLFAL